MQMKECRMSEFDVIVVGGGHAGIEATLVSSRMGCRILLITGKMSSIGMMPCNPSIGGLAKSHLVYELDALGGEMGLAADCCGIQFKTLNLSRGPAVWATRVQCDKKKYSVRMRKVIESAPRVTVLEDTVTGVIVEQNRACGVQTKVHGDILGSTVVLTTGTALRGKEYIGHDDIEGGGDGRPAANDLSNCLMNLGFELTRLKTGTPPRLYRESIDFDKTIEQPGAYPPPFISLLTKLSRTSSQIDSSECSTWNIPMKRLVSDNGDGQFSCFMTHTNPKAHQIIMDHLKDSAMYGGDIQGVGVRYCPSIEDKIVRFKGVDAHHVMLEPEGVEEEDYIYPNGLSNSLPKDVQEEMVHSIEGLEKAIFAKYGYAIEYDGIDARELKGSLESKRIDGLFFGGQVNGTTGYEEAAAQGFMAGANAALKVQQRNPLVLSRQDAYIGVLIDDLITKGTNEPYRMFTSRAERRLILRQDNARYRLYKKAEYLGVSDECVRIQTKSLDQQIHVVLDVLDKKHHGNLTLSALLSRPEMNFCRMIGEIQHKMPDLAAELNQIHDEVKQQLEILTKYRGYIEQEEKEAQKQRENDQILIPKWIDYHQIRALRYESREKLSQYQPETLGQASRISGVNPADISILALIIHRGYITK